MLPAEQDANLSTIDGVRYIEMAYTVQHMSTAITRMGYATSFPSLADGLETKPDAWACTLFSVVAFSHIYMCPYAASMRPGLESHYSEALQVKKGCFRRPFYKSRTMLE